MLFVVCASKPHFTLRGSRLASTFRKMADGSSSRRWSRRPSPGSVPSNKDDASDAGEHLNLVAASVLLNKDDASDARGHSSSVRAGGSYVTVDKPQHTLPSSDAERMGPFDICPVKKGPAKLKPSLFAVNRAKRKEVECLKNDSSIEELRPGMVLLKNYISHKDQVNIVKKCRDLGLGPGGFYQPGYRDGARLHLQMMCLGKNWDPESKLYEDIRRIDSAKPPNIPDDFKKFVENALQAARDSLNSSIVIRGALESTLPEMSPDICIMNFYTQSGKLGLHQDRDETSESIRKGLPVVSFSFGDTAEFLYNNDRDDQNAKKVELSSGDVLIFGGESRMIFHGVRSILPKTAPEFLLEETSLRPGRLNLTFRKY